MAWSRERVLAAERVCSLLEDIFIFHGAKRIGKIMKGKIVLLTPELTDRLVQWRHACQRAERKSAMRSVKVNRRG